MTDQTAPKPEQALAEATDETLVSKHTAMAVVSAFADLAAAVQVSAKPSDSILLPAPGRTLNDMVADLLRPMIKKWRDENMLEIVSQRVDEEMARIIGNRV